MDHLEFLPYHNFHIRFRLKDGRELSGVVVDTLDKMNSKKPRTVYHYIPTRNMIEFKQAENIGDKAKMDSLQSELDIKDIVWAERMRY